MVLVPLEKESENEQLNNTDQFIKNKNEER
jgi:hypothetical protein